jgi:hypothetical protein
MQLNKKQNAGLDLEDRVDRNLSTALGSLGHAKCDASVQTRCEATSCARIEMDILELARDLIPGVSRKILGE